MRTNASDRAECDGKRLRGRFSGLEALATLMACAFLDYFDQITE
jgi:hypothetical protein